MGKRAKKIESGELVKDEIVEKKDEPKNIEGLKPSEHIVKPEQKSEEADKKEEITEKQEETKESEK